MEKELMLDPVEQQEMLKGVARDEHDLKHSRKAPKRKDDPWAEKRKEDARPVEGRFRNIESPGSPLTFTYNTNKYTLKDGEIYTLPLEVARHLNNCAYKIHETALDASTDGFAPSAKIGRKIDRFAFESLVYTHQNEFGASKRVHEVTY